MPQSHVVIVVTDEDYDTTPIGSVLTGDAVVGLLIITVLDANTTSK